MPTCVQTAVFLAHLRVTVCVPAADSFFICVVFAVFDWLQVHGAANQTQLAGPDAYSNYAKHACECIVQGGGVRVSVQQR